jgi:hypothetical protein
MVYNTKDYWVFGLLHRLMFQKTQKNTFRKQIRFPKRCVILCCL